MENGAVRTTASEHRSPIAALGQQSVTPFTLWLPIFCGTQVFPWFNSGINPVSHSGDRIDRLVGTLISLVAS
jgi:hypothetical protein